MKQTVESRHQAMPLPAPWSLRIISSKACLAQRLAMSQSLIQVASIGAEPALLMSQSTFTSIYKHVLTSNGTLHPRGP